MTSWYRVRRCVEGVYRRLYGQRLFGHHGGNRSGFTLALVDVFRVLQRDEPREADDLDDGIEERLDAAPWSTPNASQRSAK